MKEMVVIMDIGNTKKTMETFKAHGSYTISNSGGYLVELSDCGEAARLQECWGGDNPQTTDWLPIEYDDSNEDEGFVGVIDPEGYDIPLNMVMRIN